MSRTNVCLGKPVRGQVSLQMERIKILWGIDIYSCPSLSGEFILYLVIHTCNQCTQLSTAYLCVWLTCMKSGFSSYRSRKNITLQAPTPSSSSLFQCNFNLNLCCIHWTSEVGNQHFCAFYFAIHIQQILISCYSVNDLMLYQVLRCYFITRKSLHCELSHTFDGGDKNQKLNLMNKFKEWHGIKAFFCQEW